MTHIYVILVLSILRLTAGAVFAVYFTWATTQSIGVGMLGPGSMNYLEVKTLQDGQPSEQLLFRISE